MIKIDLIETRGDGETDLITVTLATSAIRALFFPSKACVFRVLVERCHWRSRVELAFSWRYWSPVVAGILRNLPERRKLKSV